MQLARLTIDLFRPIPVADLILKAVVVRRGRRIQVCQAQLFSGEVEVARASALHIRMADLDPSPLPDPDKLAAEEPEQLHPPRLSLFPSPFLSGVSMRTDRPEGRAGPRAIWFRLDRPLIEGFVVSPAVRAAMTADFCNGTGAVLDPEDWTFLNADLSLHLSRLPLGDWLRLDADCCVGPQGVGLAAAIMSDVHGPVGRVAQSLLLEPRR
jgi:hypothetical protein